MTLWTIAGLFFLGWAAGTLINYLSDVLPATRQFSNATCRSCGQPYGIFDYLLLKPCRNCKGKRRARDFDLMILVVAATYLLTMFPMGRLGFWEAMVLLVYFGVVVVIDIEHRLIMHPVSLAGAVIALGIGTHQHSLVSTLIGGAFGLGIMLVVYFVGILFARWLAKRRKMDTDEEAFGFGDVALSGVLGLLLGWPGIAGGLILAVLLGGAVSLIIIVYSLLTKQYRAFMAIPYGPFLVLGALILLFRPGF